MKNKRIAIHYLSFFVLELLFIAFVVVGFAIFEFDADNFQLYSYIVLSCFAVLVLIRMMFILLRLKLYYEPRIITINNIIKSFKRGHYIYSADSLAGKDILSRVIEDIIVIGKHIETTIGSQQSEINRFHEFYSNIVFPAGAYLIVLDDKGEIIFVNDRFCERFSFEYNFVLNKRLDELFYQINDSLKDGITWARESGVHVVVEKVRMMSFEKIPIIVDANVSALDSAGHRQVIIILDDERSRRHNDYQLSLMSRIADSVKSDGAMENLFSTLLTGITSGSGLGFNRAMLFLLNDAGDTLKGKMAVGPDSFEEAIKIWNSLAEGNEGAKETVNDVAVVRKSGMLLENVLKSSFPMKKVNVFISALLENKSQHVYNADDDNRVDGQISKLMDVKEFVVVPISAMNRQKGIIVVDNKFNSVPISDYNIELLKMLAMQAAFSIESAESVTTLEKGMDNLFRKQDAIVEAEKMAAIGRIAAHIAHEIRNPLVTIGGYARRIIKSDNSSSPQDDERKRYADIILYEAERLEKILSNSMDFAKPPQQIKDYNDLNEVIDDTLNLMHNYLLEKKVKVLVRKDINAPLIKSDFNQLKQVLLNFIQNSVDAMPDGGMINIITTHSNEHLIMNVQDHGSGFAMSHIDKLFSPFFTTKPLGIGLGLSNVRKIINDHKGTVEARNMPEGGAEFTVRFPIPK